MRRGVKVDVKLFVSKARHGDKECLVALIMEQKTEYYRLAYTYMKNNEDTMDAMEDMIVILYEKIYGLKNVDVFYSWSKTILVNCCKKLLNKKKKLIFLNDIDDASYDGGFIQSEEQILLEKYLLKLNQKHAEVLKLRYFLDLDNNTIADIIGIPIGTVKSRISIGLKKLKESLGGEMNEGG